MSVTTVILKVTHFKINYNDIFTLNVKIIYLHLKFNRFFSNILFIVSSSFIIFNKSCSSIPPKFIKASYGVQKALYAKNFGYSLLPIPTYIQRQAHPPKSLPLVGPVPMVTARKGRGYKYYRPRGPPRRRKRPPVRRRPPSSYGVPIYATKYKNYTPYRRPPSKPGRYKKRRPYRPPPRRPLPYVNVHHDIDEYEQEIPDEYDDYDTGDRGEYSYIDIPSKRLPLQYDKDFTNRHADLYNRGYNPGFHRGRPSDSFGDYSLHRVRSRIRYQTSKEDVSEQADKENQESQEALWPGEVSNVNTQEASWHDQSAGQTQDQRWQESSEVHSQGTPWYDVNSGTPQDNVWPQEVRTPPPSNWHNRVNDQQSPHEWQNHQRPTRFDHQWDTYYPQSQQWAPRPTSAPDLRSWTTSLTPKVQSAAVAVPSRPVVLRESQQSNHQYVWDPSSQKYQDNRPRYQSHYSEADFPRRDGVDRKTTESHRSQRASGEPDIGFGEGLEVVDDGVAGWKVEK